MAKIDTYSDDFATADTAKWNYAAATAFTVVSGMLQGAPTGTAGNYVTLNRAAAAPSHDATGSTMTWQYVQAPNLGAGTVEVYGGYAVDAANYVVWVHVGTDLQARFTIANTQTVLVTFPYDPLLQKWLRIRESNGMVFWDVSTTGQAWVTVATWVSTLTLTAVLPFFTVGQTATETSPGVALIDNVGLPPTGATGTTSYVATSTPTPVGTTTTASTVSITPTLPTGTAAGDRVFVIQAGNNTSGATPANWSVACKDVLVGPTGTAPGAGTGRRALSIYYQDYDGVWTMPAFTLTSAAQNTHAISVITLRKAAGDTWDAPVASTPGNTSSAVTSYSVTTGSLSTRVGMVLVGSATNDPVTGSAESLTSGAMTFSGLAERSDTNSATGNDVAIRSYTASVTAGGTGTLTHAMTLSGASEGGSVVLAQWAIAAPPQPPPVVAIQAALIRANSW